MYTENLSYLAKFFLDHKNLQNELSAFYFYVLCERKKDGCHMVGYFSKEKENLENNLSCIMVLPSCQGTGYGKFIVDFSYSLSLIEKRQGSPEKPLSDLGHRTYVSYWTNRVLNFLLDNKNPNLAIQDIADATGITVKDIQYVLDSYQILRREQNKYFLFTEPTYLK